MNQKQILLFLLCIFQITNAQKKNHLLQDSLKAKSYDYLDERIYEYKKDSSKAAVYLFAYLRKAKNEQNWKEIVNGYQNLLHQSPDNLRLIYADSMILFAKKSDDNALIGSAYLSKGIVYYGQKKQILALDNYLIADSHISQSTDDYLIYKVKYHIALIKYYLGFYDEGISLLKECIDYFREENPRAYLNSLHSLGLCYNKIGNYGLCSRINALGLIESKKLEIKDMEPYFHHSQGINEYCMKNYNSAIKNIEPTLDTIRENKDFANESIGNFYIGKSYWELRKKDKALPYFQKVDHNFKTKGYIRPDLREVYELLIIYYKEKNDLKLQLYYIDQLLKADNVLDETYKYLVGKIHKEYDTKELLREKEKIQKELASKKDFDFVLVSIISFLFLVILFITYKYYKNRSLYKKRYIEQMNVIPTEDKSKPKSKIEKPLIQDINAETASVLLKQLEKFEKDKKFLDKEIGLASLAAAFNSNTKYMSVIIAHYRDKTFATYINDLRIDYIISRLKDDKRTRNFTNTALAEEAGFGTTQSFVTAFKARTGIPTAYFIEQIKKEKT